MTDFFGSPAHRVEYRLLGVYMKYGCAEWLRGASEISRLPGYDATVEEFPLAVKRGQTSKMIYWICNNGVEGWSTCEDAQQSIFYFRGQADYLLARLSA